MLNPQEGNLNVFDEKSFYALTSLLRLRNGGQIEEPTSVTGEFCDFLDLSIEAEEADSTTGIADSTGTDKELKERLLDRVAELLSDDRGGPRVTATVLIDFSDVFLMYLARNAAFDDDDDDEDEDEDEALQFLITLENFIHSMSKASDLALVEKITRFTHKAVEYQSTRIKTLLIEIRDSFRESKLFQRSNDNKRTTNVSSIVQMKLIELNDSLNSTGVDETGRLVKCVQKAYYISKLYGMEELQEDRIWTRLPSRIQQNILFLARTQIAINVIVRSARKLKVCENLSLKPVVFSTTSAQHLEEPKSAMTPSLGFRDALALADLQYELPTIRQYFGKSFSLKTAEERFTANQAEPKSTHAEMQLIVKLHEEGLLGSAQVFDYIGCSKRSCYLCGEATAIYGFRTRGCHNKLYHKWTVPTSPKTGTSQPFRACMSSLRDSMIQVLNTPPDIPIVHAKESTLGKSSLASAQVLHFDRLTSVDILQRHMSRERKDAIRALGEIHQRQDSPTPSHRSVEITDSIRESSSSSGIEDECEVCERWTATRPCSRCLRGSFCGTYCENEAGFSHRLLCTGNPPTTADWLYDAIVSDEFSRDEQVRKDFGLDQCSHWMDESRLMGLYKGLYLMGVVAKDVHTWRETGILTAKIIEKFGTLPEAARGGYFPWFLKNKHLLAGSSPARDAREDFFNPLQAVNHLLELSDRTIHPWCLQPLAKRCAFLVVSRSFQFDHFGPSVQFEGVNIWYELGYVTCDDYRERLLGGLYSKLLFGDRFEETWIRGFGYTTPVREQETCSFNNFWRAWEKGELAQCFEACGLGSELDKFAGLRRFLGYPLCSKRPEVYGLMRHLRSEDNDSEESIEAASCFGLTDALNAKERTLLPELYRRLLAEGDPNALQEALVQGRVLEYAQGAITTIEEDLKSIFRRAKAQSR